MLVRVMGASLALLSFAVVCLTGVLRGNGFASVIRASLVAMAVGGACGVCVAFIVRAVVTEQFRRQYPDGARPPEDGPRGSAAAARAAEQQRPAEPVGSETQR
jgi:hypothetical protein